MATRSWARGGLFNGDGTPVESLTQTRRTVNGDGTSTVESFVPSPSGVGLSVTEQVTDVAGRVVSDTGPVDVVDPPAPVPATTYSYFGNGLVESVTNPHGGATDTVSYSYDSRGNRTRRDEFTQNTLGGAVEAVHELWEYDLADRPTGHVDPLNAPNVAGDHVRTNYAYDTLGRVGSVEYGFDTATGVAERTETRSYWDSGRPAQVVFDDGAGTVTHRWWYDAMGRQTQTEAPRVEAPFGGAQTDSFWEYDPVGRVVSATTPDPYDTSGVSSIGYTYDPAGNMLTVKYPGTGTRVRYRYDKANRVTGTTLAYYGWWPVTTPGTTRTGRWIRSR